MFATDLLISFGFMALLFLRQIIILKRPNKINYAPLMIGIGAIGTLIHFILHPDTSNIVLLMRESIFPLLVAMILYIIMNILHQTQVSENARTQEEFIKVLVSEITQLKAFILEIEEKMMHSQESERKSQEEVREKFKNDIRALDTIQENQTKFIDKFKEMEEWHKDVSKGFDYFSEVQLPELDNVVHKHIDILRVAEQDHYNKLTTLLEKAVESRGDISEEIVELKANLESVKNISDEIAHTITKQTISELSSVTKAFESQILSLKSHSESVSTSLYESEQTLGTIRSQSEIIMKQMVLSGQKMSALEKQNSSLHDLYSTLKEIILEVESIKSDYVKAQSQLETISHDIASSKDEQILALKAKIDMLSETLSTKIDDSLEKLHEHYHITGGEITESVKMLAKQTQLKNGYS